MTEPIVLLLFAFILLLFANLAVVVYDLIRHKGEKVHCPECGRVMQPEYWCYSHARPRRAL